MPRTREHDDHTVRCGLRTYDCATTADCVRHIQKLTAQIRNPGSAATMAAVRIWYDDRDQLLDRLSQLSPTGQRPAGSPQ